ncbi:MAG: HAMP domain-containing protein [Gemmatimonadales bacterium]|nr:HAMP domain-containing protein [Gemmatimonadales bacterium]
MSFRGRLFLATSLALLVPLTVLALGVRREMDRRLSGESRRRGEAAVQALGAELARERERVAARLKALAVELSADNRFRLAAVQGQAASRAYLLDWAGGAMRLSGLSLLQIQDSTGRILSSGHFRNEYDRLRPELPDFLLAAGDTPALVRVRTAESPLLALAAAERFAVAGRPFALVGGIAAEDGLLKRLDPDPDLAVSLHTPDSAGTPRAGGQLVGEIPLPFLDAQGETATGSGRLVVTRTSGTLAVLQRGLNTWFLISLALTALLALGLAAWISRLVSRPITELAAKTATVDLDRLDVDFATARDDEIGALSRLLGAMTARLRTGAARLREAERRVAMGDLARQVNHDIKNGLVPIRNVLLHLEQVARDRPETLAEVFDQRRGTLESSVAYLDTLARNYARLSPAAAPEACDVNAMVAEVVRASGAAAVRTRLAGELPPAAADRVMLRRVLENLVGNAADSISSIKGGEVVVSTESITPHGAGPAVRVTIADTGPGMTRAELDRAFDDFYTTKADGTGLGLSIVRRLILDLGGALRIDTEPGAGTRATIEIPARPGGRAAP